jgi:hypothetical protein
MISQPAVRLSLPLSLFPPLPSSPLYLPLPRPPVRPGRCGGLWPCWNCAYETGGLPAVQDATGEMLVVFSDRWIEDQIALSAVTCVTVPVQ